MREFFVGLLVLLMFLLFSIIAVFLLPFIIVLGFFLKFIITVIFLIFAIWLVGWVTLRGIHHVKKDDIDV